MEKPPAPSSPIRIAALVAFPLLCLAVGYIFLPNPMGALEARKNVDRSQLNGAVTKVRQKTQTPLNIPFEKYLTLYGATTTSGKVKSGDELKIELFFEARQMMNENWQVFMHIDRREASHRIHGDHMPVSGRYNTSLWQKGDFVRDSWLSNIPGDAPKGEYEIWLGFYIGDRRLKIIHGEDATASDTKRTDKKNRVRVGSFRIE